MKKYISLNLILFIVFLTGTILSIFIIYKDIDTSFSLKLITGYVIYLLLYGIFIIAMVIANMRKLNWIQIRKRVFTLIIWFIFISVAHYLVFYILNKKMDVWDLGVPLATSFGLSFSDLMFKKKKTKKLVVSLMNDKD
ncbi:hypothetical protein [Lysinibacillus xylanilyticus]|uniref:hypothetical protein n=1 Tax=Lysinibacillus xylanilyticus TaxID=582475 RepID=UPI003808B057